MLCALNGVLQWYFTSSIPSTPPFAAPRSLHVCSLSSHYSWDPLHQHPPQQYFSQSFSGNPDFWHLKVIQVIFIFYFVFIPNRKKQNKNREAGDELPGVFLAIILLLVKMSYINLVPADTSTTQQLTSKQSRWVNSTTDRRKKITVLTP